MAGDWIKMRNDLTEDPAVIGIAAATDITEDEVVGKLHRLWSWADRHTTDGRAPAITARWVDRYVSATGFAAAMERFKWVAFDDNGIVFPDFDKHNGASAKARAEATERKRVSRKTRDEEVTINAIPVTESHISCDESVTREEKRREENKEQKQKSKAKTSPAAFDPIPDLTTGGVLPQTAADWLAMRKAKRAPVTATVLRNIILEVGKAGMSMDSALALACSRGWVGFQAEWVLRDQRAGPAAPYQTANDKARQWGDELIGRTTNHEHGRTIIDINEPPAGFLDLCNFAQDAP